MTSYSCYDCGTPFTRKFNLERHQARRCVAARRNLANASCSSAVDAGKEYDQIRPRDSQFEGRDDDVMKMMKMKMTTTKTMMTMVMMMVSVNTCGRVMGRRIEIIHHFYQMT